MMNDAWLQIGLTRALAFAFCCLPTLVLAADPDIPLEAVDPGVYEVTSFFGFSETLIDSNTTLNVRGGTVLPCVVAGRPDGTSENITLNLFDLGDVSEEFTANAGTEVNILGGTLGRRSTINDGAVVNLLDGAIRSFAVVNDGGVINVAGGIVGDGGVVGGAGIEATAGGKVNVSGGFFTGDLYANAGSEINISGGRIPNVTALPGSAFNFFGTSFSIDDSPIAGLIPGVPLVVTGLGGTLSATLADGSSFSFRLSGTRSEVLTTVTLVPEPASLLLALLPAITLFVSSGRRRR